MYRLSQDISSYRENIDVRDDQIKYHIIQRVTSASNLTTTPIIKNNKENYQNKLNGNN